MKKILFSTISILFLMSNFAYADTVKSSKNTKSSDINKTMTNDEFMKQFMAFEQEKDTKAKNVQVQKKLEETRKLNKTLDEINNLLGVDKK